MYPSKLKRLEKQHGKPMRELLPETANRLGSMKAVAEAWEVNPVTLSKWCKQLHIINCWRANGGC